MGGAAPIRNAQREASDHPSIAGGWLERHGDAMFRYALLRLGDRDSAEDAVQEALVAAIAGREDFQCRSSERTWLIGILRHKVLDEIRRRTHRGDREATLEQSPEQDDPPFESGFWREPVKPWPRGDLDGPEAEEFRSLLWRRITELPEPMRAAFCLRAIDGVNTDEVCKILGVTRTHLYTLVHRAKLRLRQAMTPWLLGEEGT